ncbi:NAD(P)-binding domain-containing protein [Streptomyces sp. NPDC001127]|uniref:NAD(P)-binding domain-containing protein n=1 Tax=Streptomyces sp. NPDC001127 TaxID=3154377 RepID=UPI00332BFB4C
MSHVLVSGYGVMTRGIIPHLVQSADISLALLSRHQTVPPIAGVKSVSWEYVCDSPPDVILGCFESDERSKEFWNSPQVKHAVCAVGTSCIEMSTLSHQWAIEWHSLIAAMGGTSIESPVTGSRVGASNGTLSAFVYESAKDERAVQILNAFVQNRYDFHEPGNPTLFKLVYNAWGAALLHSLTAFVPTLQASLGEDFGVAAEIVRKDGWMSLVCNSKLGRMTAGKFDDPDFALKHMVKDLRYAHEVLGTSNDLLNLVYRAFLAAEDLHGGSADYTAVTGQGDRP